MRYFIRYDDGTEIHDPSWKCVADVMRSKHGMGERVVSGELIAIPEEGDPGDR